MWTDDFSKSEHYHITTLEFKIGLSLNVYKLLLKIYFHMEKINSFYFWKPTVEPVGQWGPEIMQTVKRSGLVLIILSFKYSYFSEKKKRKDFSVRSTHQKA